jgi:hypothetical protein
LKSDTVSGFGQQQQNKEGKIKMSTMSKCTMGGHDFYYERVPLLGDGKGVAVFAIKDTVDAKEFDLYWVVIPTKSEWDKVLESPKDGHVTCMCKEVIDAKMIASSINLAFTLHSKIDTIGDAIKDKFKVLEDMYDTDAMAKEIQRLKDEGKSDAEILEAMKSKRDSFRRKTPAKKNDGGEW